jgi:hypothetical protein
MDEIRVQVVETKEFKAVAERPDGQQSLVRMREIKLGAVPVNGERPPVVASLVLQGETSALQGFGLDGQFSLRLEPESKILRAVAVAPAGRA